MLYRPSRPISELTRQRARELRASGWSYAAIQRELGAHLSRDRLKTICRGIELPSRVNVISPDRRTAIIEAYQSGEYTHNELVYEFQISFATLYNIVKQAGLSTTIRSQARSRQTAELYGPAIRRHRAGETWAEIVKDYPTLTAEQLATRANKWLKRQKTPKAPVSSLPTS
jgi:uncharacterized protein (DUF433 family)